MDHVAKVFYQEDCDLSLLYGKTIAVIGYGSQGHAHALNAKESLGDKARVIIGLYKGSKSWAKAEAQGFEVFTAAEAAKQADIQIFFPIRNAERNGNFDSFYARYGERMALLFPGGQHSGRRKPPYAQGA